MELDRQGFYEVVDKFANKDIFELDTNGNFKRTSDGNLILKNYPE